MQIFFFSLFVHSTIIVQPKEKNISKLLGLTTSHDIDQPQRNG